MQLVAGERERRPTEKVAPETPHQTILPALYAYIFTRPQEKAVLVRTYREEITWN